MEDRSFEGAVADHADAPDSQAALLETSLGSDAKVEYVALSRLTTSPLNVRRKAPTGIEGLAESISAKGLLQNLVAHALKGKRCKNAPLGVCAGQRRLAALQLLADAGRIDGAYLVPVKVVSEAEALAASLIENHSREPMHSADLAIAFLLLIEEGRSADYVAALSGLYVLSHQTNINAALSTASIAVNRRCPSVARTAPVHRRHISVTCRDKHMCNGYAVAR